MPRKTLQTLEHGFPVTPYHLGPKLIDDEGDSVTDPTANAVKVLSVDTAGEVIEKAEDAPHTSGDKGIMALGVRKDLPGSLADTDGDYVPPQFNQDGGMRVDISGAGIETMIEALGEQLLELKRIRLGHELHLWEQEVNL